MALPCLYIFQYMPLILLVPIWHHIKIQGICDCKTLNQFVFHFFFKAYESTVNYLPSRCCLPPTQPSLPVRVLNGSRFRFSFPAFPARSLAREGHSSAATRRGREAVALECMRASDSLQVRIRNAGRCHHKSAIVLRIDKACYIHIFCCED